MERGTKYGVLIGRLYHTRDSPRGSTQVCPAHAGAGRTGTGRRSNPDFPTVCASVSEQELEGAETGVEVRRRPGVREGEQERGRRAVRRRLRKLIEAL